MSAARGQANTFVRGPASAGLVLGPWSRRGTRSCGPAAIGSPRNASSCWRRSPSWSTPPRRRSVPRCSRPRAGQHLHDLPEPGAPRAAGAGHPHPSRHGAPRYHLAAEAEHVHLVCAECGRVTQVGPDAVQALVTALADHHGFETDVGHLTVFGRCADCRGPGPGGQSAGTPHHTA